MVPTSFPRTFLALNTVIQCYDIIFDSGNSNAERRDIDIEI